jgi:gamma-glutamylaminecyclotransferase
LRIEGKEEKKILKRERKKTHGHRNRKQQQSCITTTLIFTYGTLKRGFSNHVLMQDLIKIGDVVFNGIYRNE